MSFPRFLSVLLTLTYLLIIVGGATRVYDAGVSCPDWPHCYGVLIPFPESATPSGYWVNGTHYHWWQVALEWSHRSLAMLVGFGVLAIAVLATRRPRAELAATLTTIALLGVQVALGGLTVLKANINWSVVLHLGTAMLFFASLVWLRRAAAAGPGRAEHPTPAPMRAAIIAFAITVWLTMLAGAYVSSSHAGGVCGGLFSCGGEWLPADLAQHSHMAHRYMAVATIILSIVLVALAKRTAPHLRKAALHGHIMVWGQVALGVATLYSFSLYPSFYFPLSILHLAWGTLVFMVAIGMVLNLRYGQHGRFHGSR